MKTFFFGAKIKFRKKMERTVETQSMLDENQTANNAGGATPALPEAIAANNAGGALLAMSAQQRADNMLSAMSAQQRADMLRAMSAQQRSDTMHANVAAAFDARRTTVDSKTFNVEGLDGVFKLAGTLLVLVILWVALGVIAFFMSLYCFSKGGSTTGQNVIGLALAFFLGPLYWFYYAWGGSYCTSAKIAPT